MAYEDIAKRFNVEYSLVIEYLQNVQKNCIHHPSPKRIAKFIRAGDFQILPPPNELAQKIDQMIRQGKKDKKAKAKNQARLMLPIGNYIPDKREKSDLTDQNLYHTSPLDRERVVTIGKRHQCIHGVAKGQVCVQCLTRRKKKPNASR